MSLVLCPPTVMMAAASVPRPSSLALAVFLVSLETPMGAALDFCCSLSGSSRILGAGRCWHAPVVGSWHSRAKFK